MGPYIAGDTLDICGETLLAGNYKSKDPIETYDLSSGDMVDYIKWDQEDDKSGGMIMTSQFGFPKTETIVAGSTTTNDVKIFSREDSSEVAKVTGFSGPVVALHMDHKGKTMVVGSKMGGAVLLSHGNGTD